MQLACPHCSRLVQIDPALGNQSLVCLYCRGTFVLPLSSAEAPTPGIHQSTSECGFRSRNAVIGITLTIGVIGILVGIWSFVATFNAPSDSGEGAETKDVLRYSGEDKPIAQVRIREEASPVPKSAGTKGETRETRIVEALLATTSTHYRSKGFKSLEWGEPPDSAKRKAAFFDVVAPDFHELIFDDYNRLAGYFREYVGGREVYGKLISESFGKTADVTSYSYAGWPAGRLPSGEEFQTVYEGEVAVYVFPNTVAKVSFETTQGPLNAIVPSAHTTLLVMDRQYLCAELEEALKASSSAFAHAQNCFERLAKGDASIEQFDRFERVISRRSIPLPDTSAFEETTRVWRKTPLVTADKTYPDIGFAEVEKEIFRVERSVAEYRRTASDIPIPRNFGVQLWVDNSIGTQEQISRISRLDYFLERAYVQMALECFPSQRGEPARVHSGSSRRYEWQSTSGATVTLTTARDFTDGKILSVTMNKKPEL